MILLVEKISVSPLDVRGYGNVLSSKDKMDLLLSESFVELVEDTVDGSVRDVFRMFYNDPTLLFSFDRLEKCLYLNVDDGTLSFSNKRLVVDSNSYEFGFEDKVLFLEEAVGPVHSYSLSFSESSYEAVGGSAVLSLTLLDNSVPVDGALVSVTGSDSSSYTATTNSQGLATVTVNVSADTTFTASFGGVSATCTVTIPTYLFYDSCTTDNTSQYSTRGRMGSSSVAVNLSYNSTQQCYQVDGSGGDYFGWFALPNIRGNQNLRISVEFQLLTNSTYNQIFIGLTDTQNQNRGVIFTGDFFRARGDKQVDYLHNSESEIWKRTNVMTFQNNWARIEIEKVDTSMTGKVYNANGDVVCPMPSQTINTYTNPYWFIGINTRSTPDIKWIREIKVERIQ